ncbi:MAG: single-stranded-DNA-specific exonuclease RecJ [Alphaproteobacteria bacterium]|nr:single-stranded-DNA-specific exonuclease RecJ [Alphaproteobacteria bacterium]
MDAETARAFLGIERSLTGRRWRARAENERLAMAIAQRLGLPELVGRLLAGRDVSLEDCERYLDPTLRDHLPDPSRFVDMDRAATRLARAVLDGERIGIFGDYDVDGATSTALLGRYLRTLDREPLIHIPDRLREGYGPNTPALLALGAKGARVVVTVDCGTLSFEPLARARAAGIDVIVADHHLAEAALPEAAAIVNPNRLDDASGARQLAAVGVVFLLAVAVNRELRAAGFFASRDEPDLRHLLDLVALGTVADVVPLTGVNRALVAQGLRVLARRANAGLAALCDVAGLDEPPGAYHLGFLLGPRVNAGGRVGRADLGARLLMTDDAQEARSIAAELNRLNAERQSIEAIVLEDAIAAAGVPAAGEPLVMVAREGWHPGVIGIVAARLKERFERPAIVVALEGGLGKGSGRSVPGVDLGAAVTAARQAGFLVNGGGHAMAAGLTVRAEALAPLREFLAERLAGPMAHRAGRASLGLDGAISVRGANAELLEVLERAGPYGAGHPEPRLALTSCRVVNAGVVGERHVRCFLTGADGARIKAIAFRAIDNGLGEALLGAAGASLHVAGTLRADWWRGERRIQFVIEDAARL